MKPLNNLSGSMNRKTSYLSATFALAGLLFMTLGGMKCKDNCEDVICAPCPSSRLMVQYVDSTGNCDAAFYSNAMVYGFNPDNMSDTLFSWALSADSCVAPFLIQEDVIYHLVSWTPAFRDTIQISDWEYQPGVEVTECCLCYPVEHADVWFNGDSTHVEWPEGEYENVPVVRPIN
jgi:hypothetical protein